MLDQIIQQQRKTKLHIYKICMYQTSSISFHAGALAISVYPSNAKTNISFHFYNSILMQTFPSISTGTQAHILE